MELLKGTIFDIQRFSVHDGPGIRTTIFMKGCPLKCRWCHNPEGINGKLSLQYESQSCIMCGDCASICEHEVHIFENDIHRVNFSRCDIDSCCKCIDVCPSKSIKLMGRKVTSDEILKAVKRDINFYGDKGGVTFSGGECTMQPDFLKECLIKCKNAGINTAVDTCGFTKWEVFNDISEFTDIFLFDIKAVTDEIHVRGTGVSNKIILENYKKLVESGARIWIRIPVIGGYNANCGEIEKIAEFIKNQTKIPEQIELMPYHKLGSNKYEQLGMEYTCTEAQIVSKEDMNKYIKIFLDAGLPVKCN